MQFLLRIRFICACVCGGKDERLTSSRWWGQSIRVVESLTFANLQQRRNARLIQFQRFQFSSIQIVFDSFHQIIDGTHVSLAFADNKNESNVYFEQWKTTNISMCQQQILFCFFYENKWDLTVRAAHFSTRTQPNINSCVSCASVWQLPVCTVLTVNSVWP